MATRFSSLAVLSLALGLLPATLPLPAQQPPESSYTIDLDTPCWYIFFQSGKAPDRTVYILDGRHTEISDGVYQTQAIAMRETPRGDMDHWSGILQFKATPDQVAMTQGPLDKLQPLMKLARVRTISSYQMHANGKVVPGKPTEWTTFKSPIDLLSLRIVTDPKAMDRSKHYGMAMVGNMHRPIDVVDLVRRVLPTIKDQP